MRVEARSGTIGRGLLLLLLGILADVWVEGALAGQLRATGDPRTSRFVLEAKESPLDAILVTLAERYGFEVVRVGSVGEFPAVSGRFEGPLEETLKRLLKEHSHIVVRDESSRAGISRLVLMASRNPGLIGGRRPTAIPPPPGVPRPRPNMPSADPLEEDVPMSEEELREAERLDAELLREQEQGMN